jgi:hypothetical protein
VAEHTVHVDAFGGLHPSDEELAELYDLLAGHPELIGPSVSANAERGSVGLTVTVEAATRELAQVSAGKALGGGRGRTRTCRRLDPRRRASGCGRLDLGTSGAAPGSAGHPRARRATESVTAYASWRGFREREPELAAAEFHLGHRAGARGGDEWRRTVSQVNTY